MRLGNSQQLHALWEERMQAKIELSLLEDRAAPYSDAVIKARERVKLLDAKVAEQKRVEGAALRAEAVQRADWFQETPLQAVSSEQTGSEVRGRA